MTRITASLIVLLISACSTDVLLPPDHDHLSVGTWGGVNAGVLVSDTVAHVHVGCTNGNFHGPVSLDGDGRFTATGSYILRAYPIAIGPSLPAEFSGIVQANKLHLTVTVNDTVEKKVVVLGPVTVTYAQDPRMGPCPICTMPQASIAQ